MTAEYFHNKADRMYALEQGGTRLGEYYYNLRGQLVLRFVTNTVPSGWYAYFYDQDGHLIAEHDASTGAPIREYVWLGDIPVAVIEAGTTPTVYWIHPDQLGRPIAMTDAAGAFVNETAWVAFGGIHVMTGSVGLDLRFPGQWVQHEGGLHYNWHRSYDPSIARYTQPDPLGLVDGPSRYAYAGSDPLQRVDPSGQFSVLGTIWIWDHWDEIFPPSPSSQLPAMCTASDDFDWRDMQNLPASEHSKNARGSTKDKHEAGQTRKSMDQGGEKGDDGRYPPRKRPPNHKGPWPPKE